MRLEKGLILEDIYKGDVAVKRGCRARGSEVSQGRKEWGAPMWKFRTNVDITVNFTVGHCYSFTSFDLE